MVFKDIISSLYKVFNEDAYLNLTINSTIIKRSSTYSEHDKKIYVRVTSGVVENKILIDLLLSELIKGQRVKPNIKNALRVGVYMISFMNTPNHYVVNEIVKVVKKENFRASQFVNAILRRYIDEEIYDKIMVKINNMDSTGKMCVLYSINPELISLLKSQYEDVESIIKPNESHLNCYRINTLKVTPKEVENILIKQDINYVIDGVTLKTLTSLINHELFLNGCIVAQDASSIKVAEVVNPKPNSHIIDACSAPGAKSMHLAAIMNNTGHIISCDVHEHKLKLIEDNARKLGVTNIEVKLADGAKTSYDELFDIVLLDVPCSGLGVINHKSDLKYKMTIDKIEAINKLQKQIIENMCKYVKSGGNLVYSTCTINKNENEKLIKEFLKRHSEFKLIEEHIIVQNYKTNEDGFYIAKLERN